MDRPRSWPAARLAALLFVGSALCASLASAEIYSWVDHAGTHHYTDRIEEVPREFLREAMSQGELDAIPFNQLDGLTLLPGEADGTDAGRARLSADPAELRAQLENWLERSGPALIAGLAFAVLLIAGLVFASMAGLLLLACRVVGEDRPDFKKAYGIVIVQTLAGLLAAPGLVLVAGQPDPADFGGTMRFQLASLAMSVVVNALVLRGMLTDSVSRALVLAVVTILVTVGVGIAIGVGVAILAFALA